MAHGRPRKEICYKCEMYGLTPRFSKSACPNCKGDVEQISLDGLKEILKTTSNFFPLSFTWISFNTDDRTIQLNDDDMKTHYLKTWPKFFEDVASGKKTFELRKDDRGFEIGDTVILDEWCPDKKEFTKRRYNFTIKYKLTGGQFGLENGYCILNW